MLFQLQKLHVIHEYINTEWERSRLPLTTLSRLHRLCSINYEDSSESEIGWRTEEIKGEFAVIATLHAESQTRDVTNARETC